MNTKSEKSLDTETGTTEEQAALKKIWQHTDYLIKNEPYIFWQIQSNVLKLPLADLIRLSEIKYNQNTGSFYPELADNKDKNDTGASNKKGSDSLSSEYTLAKLAAEIKVISKSDTINKIALHKLAKKIAEEKKTEIIKKIEQADLVTAMHFLSLTNKQAFLQHLPTLYTWQYDILSHVKTSLKNELKCVQAIKSIEILANKPIYNDNFFTEEERAILSKFNISTIGLLNINNQSAPPEAKINIVLIQLNYEANINSNNTTERLDKIVNHIKSIAKLLIHQTREDFKKIQSILHRNGINQLQGRSKIIEEIIAHPNLPLIIKSLKQINKTKSQRAWRENLKNKNQNITFLVNKELMNELTYLWNLHNPSITNNRIPKTQMLLPVLEDFVSLPTKLAKVSIAHYYNIAKTNPKTARLRIELTLPKALADKITKLKEKERISYSLLARIAVLYKLRNPRPSILQPDLGLFSKFDQLQDQQPNSHRPSHTEYNKGWEKVTTPKK